MRSAAVIMLSENPLEPNGMVFRVRMSQPMLTTQVGDGQMDSLRSESGVVALAFSSTWTAARRLAMS